MTSIGTRERTSCSMRNCARCSGKWWLTTVVPRKKTKKIKKIKKTEKIKKQKTKNKKNKKKSFLS